MTNARIQELRSVANKHRGHKSAAMILELCDELERTQNLYCLALEFGWSNHRSKAIAFSKLKQLAERG